MTIALPWLFMGGVTVMLGGFALLNVARNRKRTAAYAEYCLIRGFTFAEERPGEEQRYAAVFEPFAEGRRHHWGKTISGTKNQAPFTAFEYRWMTGHGKSASTHWLGGVVWEQDKITLPKFAVSPEGWFSRLGDIFGMQDIDFPESPEFSGMYRLKGPDEAAIRQLFTTDIRRFLEATPKQQIAGGGKFLFWFRHQLLPAADQLDEWLEQGDHVRRRFFSS
jgi:hypothetical protein